MDKRPRWKHCQTSWIGSKMQSDKDCRRKSKHWFRSLRTFVNSLTSWMTMLKPYCSIMMKWTLHFHHYRRQRKFKHYWKWSWAPWVKTLRTRSRRCTSTWAPSTSTERLSDPQHTRSLRHRRCLTPQMPAVSRHQPAAISELKAPIEMKPELLTNHITTTPLSLRARSDMYGRMHVTSQPQKWSSMSPTDNGLVPRAASLAKSENDTPL